MTHAYFNHSELFLLHSPMNISDHSGHLNLGQNYEVDNEYSHTINNPEGLPMSKFKLMGYCYRSTKFLNQPSE